MVFESIILAQREVARGTHEVTFKRPSNFTFSAGQYMQVAVPQLKRSDPKGPARLFSITSSPYDFEKLSVVFRSTGSGFKETLKELQTGSVVRLEQASGSFLLPQKLVHPQVFVAGGIGISPFMSYLHQKIQDEWEQPITLLYGNQNPESTAYLDELRLMAKQQKKFLLNEIYKRPTLELFAKLSQKHKNAMWWVVGPPAMVATTVNGLQVGGVKAENIRTESFDGY